MLFTLVEQSPEFFIFTMSVYARMSGKIYCWLPVVWFCFGAIFSNSFNPLILCSVTYHFFALKLSRFVVDVCIFLSTVQSSQNSIPAPPGNFKLREDHMSGSSIKGGIYCFTFASLKTYKHYELKK